MTVDEGIELQKRAEAHWEAIGDEKRRELKLAMKAAAAKSAEVAESILRAGGFNKHNRQIFDEANLAYDECAKAYYGF